MYKCVSYNCNEITEMLDIEGLSETLDCTNISTNLVNRVRNRLLIEIIFRALPNNTELANIPIKDFKLLKNINPEDRERFLDLGHEMLASYLYNKQLRVDNYHQVSAELVGNRLFLKLGMRRDESE